jgi:5-methylcytosine-specific restriction endonuclease McrA
MPLVSRSMFPLEPMRECYRCLRERADEAFIRRVDDRHYRMCRSCVSEVLLARTGRKERLLHTKDDRICYLCRRRLPNSQFTQRTNGSYFSACRDCNRHVFAQRRRARLKANGGSYTLAEWQQLLKAYEKCPMCLRLWATISSPPNGTVITIDHIVPLASGGSNAIENIQPLCFSCNSRKGARAFKPGAYRDAGDKPGDPETNGPRPLRPRPTRRWPR